MQYSPNCEFLRNPLLNYLGQNTTWEAGIDAILKKRQTVDVSFYCKIRKALTVLMQMYISDNIMHILNYCKISVICHQLQFENRGPGIDNIQ